MKPLNPARDARLALGPLQTAGGTAPVFLPLPKAIAKGGWIATLHQEIEGVHFDPTFLNPFDLGRKSVNTALFHLAAGGIEPATIQAGVGINQGTTETFLDEVFRGMKKAAARQGVEVSLGSSVHSPTCFLLNLMCFGKRRAAPTASKASDILAVTGTLGTAAAGVHCLRRFGWPAIKDHARVVRSHLCPDPPLDACLAVDPKQLSGCYAIVDGLCSELHRFARATGMGVQIEEKRIPVLEESREAARLLSLNVRRWALYGADDLQLLVSVPPKNWARVSRAFKTEGTPLTAIGEARPGAVRMWNLEGEQVVMPDRSWNPIVRRKSS
jgi:thiamine-monophosphate kinase